MHKKLVLILLLILVIGILLISACRVGSSPLAGSVTIHVSASQDFGRKAIFDREAVIDKRMNAQDVLAKVTSIQMDSSYVVEFEGLRGNDHDYWMYYINGLLSKVFASGYLIRPGDVMYWDYHSWVGAFHGSSAIIGSFPEPMVHGYEGLIKPTLVAYNPQFSDEAKTIAAKLTKLGVTQVSIREESTLNAQDKGNNNVVLVADKQSPLITELNKQYQSLGMYSYFDGDKLKVTDYKFASQQEYGAGTGIIQACQNPWNPLGTGSCQNVVLMISGADAAGVKIAAKTLIDSADDILTGRPSAIQDSFGIIVLPSGEIIKTPL